MRKIYIVCFLILGTLTTAFAQADLPFTEDFSSFTGSGFTPTPAAGQLDSDDWSISGFGTNVAFGGTGTSGDAARGTDTDGGVGTGGVYAFTVSSNTFFWNSARRV